MAAKVKSNPQSTPATRSRGRPRSDSARLAILRAARELIEENGPTALTMEGIAARAGVGKPTIYRWWPDRHSVAMAALMEGESAVSSSGSNSRSPLGALHRQIRKVVSLFATPMGRNVTTMIASADHDSELAKAFRNHFVLARREEGRTLLLQAIDRGEIRPDANIEIVLDMIYGALFFRLLMGHAALDDALVQQLLAESLRGLTKRSVAKTGTGERS
jgi:AcrR family transcriptional regulator